MLLNGNCPYIKIYQIMGNTRSAETDLQEVVWRHTDDLKEQRDITWETRRDDGYVQGAGHQTAVEQIVLQESLSQMYKHMQLTAP